MKAMVLCAGLGTRLRPLTLEWPKPALPLLGQPLFRYTLATLQRAGVTAVGINTHHLPEKMAAVAQSECDRRGMSLRVSHEPELLGTAGGIRGLKDFLNSDPFVVVNGDNLFAVDLKTAVAAHQASGAIATLVLLPMPEGAKYNAVELDGSRSVRRLAGHGPGGEGLSSWHFTGVHVLSPKIFDFMAASGPEDSVRDVYPRVLAAGETIYGHVVQTSWSDLGNPSSYLATVRSILQRQVPLEAFPGASPFDGTTSEGMFQWRGARAQVQARGVSGPAFFDADSFVADDVKVGEAVYVGARARVGAGARLHRVVVMEGSEVLPDENLVETIVWKNERIPAALTLPDSGPARR